MNPERGEYKYSRLSSERSEIRLLTIHNGRFNEPVQCSLSKVSLLSNPSFEAVSYSWGNPAVAGHIRVNGKSLGVAGNLYMALPYLRFEKVPRVMWIDAICVDQSNQVERGEQIRHMAKIYSTARDVDIWLGESSNLSEKLFPLIDITVGIGERALTTAWQKEYMEKKKRL